MPRKDSLPCRHRGAPPEEVVQLVMNLIQDISKDEGYLYNRGLSKTDYELALPAAVERLRGRSAAKSTDRRNFILAILDHLKGVGLINSYEKPKYGRDTIYRLYTEEAGEVAIIQKGCPDGAHSSTAWSVPDWADETYLWWVCPSIGAEPGEHVAKGVNRLKTKFLSENTRPLSGLIFQSDLCGSDLRPCPKSEYAIQLNGMFVPPPCVWVLPDRGADSAHNWDGLTERHFPKLLLSAFGIKQERSKFFIGNIGFMDKGGKSRFKIVSRYDEARTTGYRG